jgi:hypothetical protein
MPVCGSAASLHGAQAGDCLPEEFLALRPAYDSAVARCGDKACLEGALDAFRKNIEAVAKRCAANIRNFSADDGTVAPAVQALLRKRIMKAGGDELGALDDTDGRQSISFQVLTLGLSTPKTAIRSLLRQVR